MAYRYPLATTTTAAAALFLALGIGSCEAFVGPTRSHHVTRNPCVTAPPVTLSMSSSSDDESNNDGDDDDDADDEPSASQPEDRTNADSMRSLLESSWNVGTMGAVPTSPQSAAHSASEAIGSALSRNKKLLQVDIRLPSFDVTQGPNIYDEISSVEFCCQLADNLCTDGNCSKALILVRDGSAVRSAARILDVKERRRREDEEEKKRGASRLMPDEDEEDEDDDDVVSASESTAEDDDSSPRTGGGGSDDIDSFRKQLQSGWGDDDGTGTSSDQEREMDPANDPSMIAASRTRRGREELKPSVNFNPSSASSADTNEPATNRSYRLGSLFGDDTISTGADMFTDAIEAVDTHGTMLNIEDVLIILSPVTREDTVATRRLISRYGDTKTIVLVNNRLHPEPKELFLSEPVYSITPLVARATKSEGNFMQNQGKDEEEEDEDEAPPTKIIVMRRYPTDWEIFVDVDGNGFELVDSAPAVAVGKTGPDNEFVAGCVKKHMAFKFGQY